MGKHGKGGKEVVGHAEGGQELVLHLTQMI